MGDTCPSLPMPVFTPDLLERIAEQVHVTWAQGRQDEGWVLGPVRDDALRQHPCLIPYAALPEEEKAFDRQTALASLQALVALGYRILPPEEEAVTVLLPSPAATRQGSQPLGHGPLQPGLRVGRYHILDRLGGGGFGEVWHARDTGITGREVAIKAIRLGHDSRENLGSEARIMTRIFHHPNFPVLYDVLEQGGEFFLVVEFLPGYDLDRLTREGQGPVGWADVRAVLAGVLAGLHHAHRYEVLHQDLKPSNIRIFNPLGRFRPIRERDVKILDFGLAFLWKEDGVRATLAGTPAYMSPEQIQGLPLTPASDLYTVGLILYELVTCRHPFQVPAEAPFEAHREARCGPPPCDPATWRPGLPADLGTVLARCLAKDPAQRYQEAQALEGDLLPILDRLSLSDPAPTRWEVL